MITLKYKNFSESNKKLELGCIMLEFDNNTNNKITELLKQIKESDLYIKKSENHSYGIEKESHVTVLYGIHDKQIIPEKLLNDLKSIINNKEHYSLNNISAFENENFDVLKLEVNNCRKLINCNNYLRTNYDYTSDYPDYNPHVTLAYLKPGYSKKYIKEFKSLTLSALPATLIYSNNKRIKTKIDL